MNRNETLPRRGWLVALVFLTTTVFVPACAGKRPVAESASSPRIKDSVPERRASQRAATPGLQLEQEDQRWGTEAAREAREARETKEAKEKKRRDAAATGTPGSFAPALPGQVPAGTTPAQGGP